MLDFKKMDVSKKVNLVEEINLFILNRNEILRGNIKFYYVSNNIKYLYFDSAYEVIIFFNDKIAFDKLMDIRSDLISFIFCEDLF